MRANEFINEAATNHPDHGFTTGYHITGTENAEEILLLIDWWEHAFILDYGSDKKKYIKEQWKIINWNVINTRWGKSL